MRHQVRTKKLGMDASHRKAILRSLAIGLIEHHRLVTTFAKAKELSRVVDPLINRAKEDSTHNRRVVYRFLQNNDSTSHLFEEIGPKAANRNGGYTRVIKLGNRKGDGADMALIELVDYNDIKPEGAVTKKKRTRRAGKKAAPTKVSAEAENKNEETAEK